MLLSYLNKIQKQRFDELLYTFAIIILYLTYFFIAIGMFPNNPEYVTYLTYFIRLYICIMLIIRFNPFRKLKYTEFDKNLVFGAALFMLSTLIVNVDILSYIKKYF